MAEAEKVTTNQNENGAKDEPKIEIEIDPIKFDSISEVTYLKAHDFCEMVSAVFRGVFADFEGCKLQGIQKTNLLELVLFFNHNNYNGVDMPVAITKDPESSNTKNSTIRLTRMRDMYLQQGDRYFLTKDAQDAIKPFLRQDINFIYGNNGAVNWGRVVSEEVDQAPQTYYGLQSRLQFTSAHFIDPDKLACKFFGTDSDSEDGSKWVYQVRVAGTIFNGYNNNNPDSWVIAIDRVSDKEVKKMLGLFNITTLGNGLGIVR